MIELLKVLANILNGFHDILIELFRNMGFNISDKEMHFIVIGFIGMTIFFFSYFLFKELAKLSMIPVAFIYTFTVLIIFAIAIEVVQKLTKRGNVEFKDVTAGLWGFIIPFGIFLFIYIVVKIIISVVKNAKYK